MSIEIKVNTFIGKDQKGSIQILRFYSDLDSFQKSFDNYKVVDEFDHSFVVYDPHLKKIRTLWKNKNGPIQFCGSAAFALSWLISKTGQNREIISDYINFESLTEGSLAYLKFPAKKATLFKKTDQGILYHAKEAGIYLLHSDNLVLLKPWDYFASFIEKEKLLDIHGFCVFTLGHLRYFTPWHGRDEDTVTGSIHQYLTPLMDKLGQRQHWIQGGELFSRLEGSDVYLTGDCLINNSQSKNSFIEWMKMAPHP